MRSRLMRRLCVGGLCLFSLTLYASPNDLKRINQDITRVEKLLKQKKVARQVLVDALSLSETEQGKITQSLTHIRHEMAHQETLLANLNSHQKEYGKQLAAQQHALAIQVNARYRLGRQSYIKRFLNANHISLLRRFLVYYGYLDTAYVQLIQETRETLQVMQAHQQEIALSHKKLAELLEEKEARQTLLGKTHTNRSALVEALDETIATKQHRLNRLTANKTALEQAISRAMRAEKASDEPLPGQFVFPARGKRLLYFGQPIAGSELRWQGIVVQAAAGSPVRAMAPGRVIFAKWLAGYGLLVIVRHAQGLMSLYGRNQTILVAVGQSVKAGELIARVGQTGGYQTPGLYFEIRQSGKPVNPRRYFR